MQVTLAPQTIEALVHGECADVFSALGMHPLDEGCVVRAFLPDATSVRVVERGGQNASFPAAKIHADGLFEARITGRSTPFAYHLEVTDAQGEVRCCRDPYSFWPQFAPQDQYLFNEGTLYRAYEMLGAHPRCIDGTEGTYFAVWAPSARRVSVVGDFNGWDGRRHCMRSLGASGVWELFIPEVGAGALYKYEILSRNGDVLLKSDPFAFASEPTAPHCFRSLPRRCVRLERRRMDGCATGAQLSGSSPRHLRGAPRLLAPRPRCLSRLSHASSPIGPPRS